MGWDYESRMHQATECLCKAKAALEKIKDCTQQVEKITEKVEMDDGQYKRMLVDLSASSYQELLRYRDITKELLIGFEHLRSFVEPFCCPQLVDVDSAFAGLGKGTTPFETDMLPEDPK